MFWIFLVLCFLGALILYCSEDAIGAVVFVVGIIVLLVQLTAVPSKTLITVYEEQSLAYEAGKYDDYDELYTYKQVIDEYNDGLENAQKGFLVWPFVSKKWKKCEKAEYPEDLHDKMIEALKKEEKIE